MSPSHAPAGCGRGVLLCAVGDLRYTLQAYLAARSARRYLPDFAIALFTDRPRHPVAALATFDQVHAVEVEEEFRTPWVTGKFPRLKALMSTPFAETLHIDCDVRVVDPSAAGVFSELGGCEIAFAECHRDTSFTCRRLGRRMFNGGVIAYRRTDRVMLLFERWEELTRHHHRLALRRDARGVDCLEEIPHAKTRRRLLGMDQLSLLQLLSPETNVLGLELCVLHESWNSRKRGRAWEAEQAVKLDHSPSHHETVCSDALREARTLEKAGERDEAQVLCEAVEEVVATSPLRPRAAGGVAR